MTEKPSSAETAKVIKTLLQELPEERIDAARLNELRRVFSKLVSNGDLNFSSSSSNHDELSLSAKWNVFLQKRHHLFVEQLCQRIKEGKRTAIRTMWGVIAASPVTSSCHKRVNPDLMYLWMRSMTFMPHMENSTSAMIQGEFLQLYHDVQYYALTSLTKLAAEGYFTNNDKHAFVAVAELLFPLLLMIPVPTTQEEMEKVTTVLVLMMDEKDGEQDEDSDTTDQSSDETSVATDEESFSSYEEEDRPAPKKLKKETSQRRFSFHNLSCTKRHWRMLGLQC